MTESRVEAVARALAAAANWVWDGLADDVKDYWHELAQAAIEANDAWIAAQIAAQDPIAFRRTKSPRIEGLDAITRRILDR